MIISGLQKRKYWKSNLSLRTKESLVYVENLEMYNSLKWIICILFQFEFGDWDTSSTDMRYVMYQDLYHEGKMIIHKLVQQIRPRTVQHVEEKLYFLTTYFVGTTLRVTLGISWCIWIILTYVPLDVLNYILIAMFRARTEGKWKRMTMHFLSF